MTITEHRISSTKKLDLNLLLEEESQGRCKLQELSKRTRLHSTVSNMNHQMMDPSLKPTKQNSLIISRNSQREDSMSMLRVNITRKIMLHSMGLNINHLRQGLIEDQFSKTMLLNSLAPIRTDLQSRSGRKTASITQRTRTRAVFLMQIVSSNM